MMEKLKLKLDSGTKFLIGLNIFFLISIVTGAIIHDLLRDYISVHVGIGIGLSIGLGVMIVTYRQLRKRNGVNKNG